MKLTDRIKQRFLNYKEDCGESLHKISQDINDPVTYFTYESLRLFINTDATGSGFLLNALDEFLTEKGY